MTQRQSTDSRGDHGAPLLVDRIEGNLAVVEIGQLCVHIPLSHLPEGVAEGDGLVVVFSDPEALDTSVLDALRGRDPGDSEIEL